MGLNSTINPFLPNSDQLNLIFFNLGVLDQLKLKFSSLIWEWFMTLFTLGKECRPNQSAPKTQSKLGLHQCIPVNKTYVYRALDKIFTFTLSGDNEG